MGSPANGERVSWLGLNAYGLFVAVLVVLVGTRYLLNPTGQLITGAGHVGYLTSGLGLIYAYARSRVDVEVYASILLVLGNVLILAGRTLDQGFDVYNAVLTVALGTLVAVRVGALLRGGTYVLPRWER